MVTAAERLAAAIQSNADKAKAAEEEKLKKDELARQEILAAQDRMAEWRANYRPMINRAIVNASSNAARGTPTSPVTFFYDHATAENTIRFIVRRADNRANNGFIAFALSDNGQVVPSSGYRGQSRPWDIVPMTAVTEEWVSEIATNVLADEVEAYMTVR